MDEYSAAAREAISQCLPALASELREQEDGSLFLESLSPSGHQFWVSTAGDEITVGFDAHHVHFGTPWEPDATDDVRDACEYIQKLMQGEYQVAVWYRRGRFVRSETIERGVDPAKLDRPWLGRWWLRGCVVEVHGW